MKRMHKEHFAYLDGIRGLMCINVVICHFVVVYYPELYFEEFADLSILGKIVGGSPLSVFVNGDIAVRYFFVLSGFLIAFSTFKNRSYGAKLILSKMKKRYFRLLPIISIATIFTFILMKFDLLYHLNIVDIVQNSTFLQAYCNFDPTIPSLFNNIFIKVFITGSDYVGPFWTIRYELWGPLVALILCSLLHKRKSRRLLYVLIVVPLSIFVDSNLLSLFIGVFVADLLCFPDKDTTIFSKYYFTILNNKLFIIIISIVGLYCVCVPMYFAGIYQYWNIIPYLFPGILRSIGVGLLLYVLLKTPQIRKPFESKLLQLLGRISFSVYAIHWTLMLSLQAWLFMNFSSLYSYSIAALLSFGITCIAIFIVAYIIWFVVERNPSILHLHTQSKKN